MDNSYFDDAAFVATPAPTGFMIYSGIGTGTNLTSNGLSIFKLEEKKALTIDGVEYTLLEALAPGPVRQGLSVPGGQRAGLFRRPGLL